MTLLYNMLMLAVDAAALWFIVRRRGWAAWFTAMSCAAGAAVVLGLVLGVLFENHFGVYRLWSYGIFLHGIGLSLAGAFILSKKRPVAAGMIVAAAGVLIAVAIDAFLIEPTWLEVSHWTIESPKISRPIRIVVVADLQTDSIGRYERAALRRAVDEKPDLILLSGDYIQSPWQDRERLRRELNEYLKEIGFDAPLGVFAVRGNIDPDDWAVMFKGTKVEAIDARKTFELGDLRLTCLGLVESYKTNTKVVDRDPRQFHIVLGHVPNFALGTVEADLLVAGHTHGGQVRLPWIGPISTHSKVPNAWAAGITDLPGGGRLAVCRGIGLERHFAPPIRFFCRPELMVIELVPRKK